jgi:hypothetical protein
MPVRSHCVRFVVLLFCIYVLIKTLTLHLLILLRTSNTIFCIILRFYFLYFINNTFILQKEIVNSKKVKTFHNNINIDMPYCLHYFLPFIIIHTVKYLRNYRFSSFCRLAIKYGTNLIPVFVFGGYVIYRFHSLFTIISFN